MLTVVDRPLIQIVVDEARAAGIEHLIFVTGRNKTVIEDHFDKQYELESTLRKRGRSMELTLLEEDLPAAGQASFTRQQEPLGLGHAIWCARNLVGSDPFAVLLPDMIIRASPGCLSQMVEIYQQRGGGNILAVEEAPLDCLHRYGVVEPVDWRDNHFRIRSMVEKPGRSKAPSNLIISGRYILQPEIFAELDRHERGAGGEIQITDAMTKLSSRQPFYGVKYDGTSFDCGDKIGFLSANVSFALEHEDLSLAFREALTEVISKHGGQVTWTRASED
jgi:UTP--glucose-1-phosphate uridylyltransferase